MPPVFQTISSVAKRNEYQKRRELFVKAHRSIENARRGKQISRDNPDSNAEEDGGDDWGGADTAAGDNTDSWGNGGW